MIKKERTPLLFNIEKPYEFSLLRPTKKLNEIL